MHPYNKEQVLSLVENLFKYSDLVYMPIAITVDSLQEIAAYLDGNAGHSAMYTVTPETFHSIVLEYENNADYVWEASNEALENLVKHYILKGNN